MPNPKRSPHRSRKPEPKPEIEPAYALPIPPEVLCLAAAATAITGAQDVESWMLEALVTLAEGDLGDVEVKADRAKALILDPVYRDAYQAWQVRQADQKAAMRPLGQCRLRVVYPKS